MGGSTPTLLSYSIQIRKWRGGCRSRQSKRREQLRASMETCKVHVSKGCLWKSPSSKSVEVTRHGLCQSPETQTPPPDKVIHPRILNVKFCHHN